MKTFGGEHAIGEPTVSVIIPAFNTARYIAEALDSVFAQGFSAYEVIVVNDGSPDTLDLERALAPYQGRINYIWQENRGVAAARNTGLRAARGRFVAFLDSDDLWEPEYLARQVAALEQDESIDAIFPNVVTFGGTIEDGCTLMDHPPLRGEITFERMVAGECSVSSALTVRREVLERVGMFDEAFATAEDFELWLRILHTGGRIAYHREVLVRYRKHPASLSADPTRMLRPLLQVLAKVEQSLPLTPQQQSVVRQRVAHAQAMLALCEGKKAFFRGDNKEAIRALHSANLVLRSWKLWLIVALLHLAPAALYRAYVLRDRALFNASTRF